MSMMFVNNRAVQAAKRIKWEAWNKLRGMTKQAAMTAYVNEILAMASKFNVNAYVHPPTRHNGVMNK